MGPVMEKVNLWAAKKGNMRGRFSEEVKDPAVDRDDIPSVILSNKLDRGSRVQELRLRYYPSIDVDYNKLFAGKIEGDLEDATSLLNSMGYRNNPTAYVEVTKEHGPDEGSYARQIVTESGVRFDRPHIHSYPTLFRREKRQIHITILTVGEEVHFLAHEEKSAWLQPMRHVGVPDSSAEIGIRDFRDDWYDQFNTELPGKDQVIWDTTH